jgi:hypothetical protein
MPQRSPRARLRRLWFQPPVSVMAGRAAKAGTYLTISFALFWNFRINSLICFGIIS